MQFMLPEFIVMGTAFIILIADLMMRESRRKIIAPMALLGLAAARISRNTGSACRSSGRSA
jgi:NADH:ubiquinone oxidoreductase subunit 2 (subunit N)